MTCSSVRVEVAIRSAYSKDVKIMSSASPPKEPEVEPGTQSGDDAEHMEREHQDTQAQGQGEFEVKEQDRWLPIANGSLSAFLHVDVFDFDLRIFLACYYLLPCPCRVVTGCLLFCPRLQTYRRKRFSI